MCRPRGFRFSRTNAIVLLAGAVLTALLLPVAGTFALVVPVTLAHFFCFCNVFRVRRGPELAWAALFVVNFAAWAIAGAFTWTAVLAVQTPVTVLVIVLAVRRPDYRGVLSRDTAEH